MNEVELNLISQETISEDLACEYKICSDVRNTNNLMLNQFDYYIEHVEGTEYGIDTFRCDFGKGTKQYQLCKYIFVDKFSNTRSFIVSKEIPSTSQTFSKFTVPDKLNQTYENIINQPEIINKPEIINQHGINNTLDPTRNSLWDQHNSKPAKNSLRTATTLGTNVEHYFERNPDSVFNKSSYDMYHPDELSVEYQCNSELIEFVRSNDESSFNFFDYVYEKLKYLYFRSLLWMENINNNCC